MIGTCSSVGITAAGEVGGGGAIFGNRAELRGALLCPGFSGAYFKGIDPLSN
jgi:hypothetical protein